MKIPWLSKKSIAAAADGVIAGYEAIVKRRVKPPIPVENIIERGLDLRLGFADLRNSLRLDDVLGATFVNKKMIYVDRSLAENQNEGRLCFTFAHETGHWVLHRKLVDHACRTGQNRAFTRLRHDRTKSAAMAESEPGPDQAIGPNGFGAVSPINFEQEMGGLIFCRIRDAKEPIEWQADYFASCLLMPAGAVKDAFHQCFGSKPLILFNVKSAYSGPVCFDPSVETWPRIAEVVRDAGGFSNVSRQAMIIKLQDLGLVKNETRVRLSWKKALMTA